MDVEYKLNRLDTSGISPLVDEHWRGLREAKKEGRKVTWVSGPLWAYRLAFPNMEAHFMAGYAAYCGGRRMGQEVLDAADRYGEPKDACSYHRLHTGMAQIIMSGESVTDPRVILPLPDLMIATRACPEMVHYAEALHRRFGIKAVVVEWPRPLTKEDLPRLARYVRDQVNETVIPALEELGGQKYDEERLRECFRVWKETCLLRNKCWQFFKRKPSSWTLWDYGVSMAPLAYAMGNPKGLVYYQNLLKQLEERAEKNIPALSPKGEKYRLFWVGWLPWAFMGRIIRLMVPRGAIPICGRYPWEFAPEPEDINPEADDIIYEWIRLHFEAPNMTSWHGSVWGGVEYITHLVKEYSCDGILWFSSKTCRAQNLGEHDILNTIDKEEGIPGVVIEGDMIDPAMFSEEQMRTRIEALLEIIDSRRRK